MRGHLIGEDVENLLFVMEKAAKDTGWVGMRDAYLCRAWVG